MVLDGGGKLEYLRKLAHAQGDIIKPYLNLQSNLDLSELTTTVQSLLTVTEYLPFLMLIRYYFSNV